MIQVPSGVVDATQQVSAQVAQTTSQVGSTLGGASGGASACDPRAAGAYDAMQAAWTGQISYLARCDGGLAEALGNAAGAYPGNDDAQMVVVWTLPSPIAGP